MDTQKKEIEDLIAKTIRQIGHEKDMQDIETLRSFTANIKRKSRPKKNGRYQKNLRKNSLATFL